MRVDLICPDDRAPKPMDTIVSVSYDASGVVRVYAEETRVFYAKRLIASPQMLFKWSLRIAWIDLKGIVRGAPKRPIETVADALERD